MVKDYGQVKKRKTMLEFTIKTYDHNLYTANFIKIYG